MDLATRQILEKRLSRAEIAYDELMTGKAVRVLVDQSGERIEYTAANAGRLSQYIDGLKRQLGVAAAPLGPMRFIF